MQETRFLHLPQFEESDHPSWLTDFNGAMSAIDVAYGNLLNASGGGGEEQKPQALNPLSFDSAEMSVTGTAFRAGGQWGNRDNTWYFEVTTPFNLTIPFSLRSIEKPSLVYDIINSLGFFAEEGSLPTEYGTPWSIKLDGGNLEAVDSEGNPVTINDGETPFLDMSLFYKSTEYVSMYLGSGNYIGFRNRDFIEGVGLNELLDYSQDNISAPVLRVQCGFRRSSGVYFNTDKTVNTTLTDPDLITYLQNTVIVKLDDENEEISRISMYDLLILYMQNYVTFTYDQSRDRWSTRFMSLNFSSYIKKLYLGYFHK